MKAMQHTPLMLALAGALAMPTALWAADATKDEHAAHHPVAAPVATETAAPATVNQGQSMQTMRDRMREIQQTADPEKRKALIETQMKAMEAMMNDPNRNCPMAEARDGKAMMGGGMDMKGGKCGKGMMSGGMDMKDGKCGKGMMSGGMDMKGGKCGKGMMGGGMDMKGGKCDKGMMGGMQGGMGMAGKDDMMAKRMEMMEKRMDMMQMMLQMRMQGMGGGMGMPSN